MIGEILEFIGFRYANTSNAYCESADGIMSAGGGTFILLLLCAMVILIVILIVMGIKGTVGLMRKKTSIDWVRVKSNIIIFLILIGSIAILIGIVFGIIWLLGKIVCITGLI